MSVLWTIDLYLLHKVICYQLLFCTRFLSWFFYLHVYYFLFIILFVGLGVLDFFSLVPQALYHIAVPKWLAVLGTRCEFPVMLSIALSWRPFRSGFSHFSCLNFSVLSFQFAVRRLHIWLLYQVYPSFSRLLLSFVFPAHPLFIFQLRTHLYWVGPFDRLFLLLPYSKFCIS